MAKKIIKVVPNCRYDHGNLVLVVPEKDLHGNDVHWGYATAQKPPVVFEGDLYFCETCGYTEFFDNDPKLTILNNEINGAGDGSS